MTATNQKKGSSPRFQVHHGSDSAHCCFAATVVDTSDNEIVCECFSVADAQRVCDALNAQERSTP